MAAGAPRAASPMAACGLGIGRDGHACRGDCRNHQRLDRFHLRLLLLVLADFVLRILPWRAPARATRATQGPRGWMTAAPKSYPAYRRRYANSSQSHLRLGTPKPPQLSTWYPFPLSI